MQRVVRLVALIIWLILLACLWEQSAKRTDHYINAHKDKVQPVPFSILNPKILEIFSMGRKGLYDDFAQLWMVQTLVNSEKMKADPKGTIEAVQFMLKQSPKIEGFYMLACIAMFNDIDHPRECESIVTTGIRLFPNSFRLPMMLGYVMLFELNQKTKAAGYYAMAATRPDAPPYPEKLAKRLLSQEGDLSPEQLGQVLEEVSNSTNDEAWKKIFLDKYDELKNEKQKREDP